MKDDPAYVFKASTQASRVADYLLAFVRKEEGGGGVRGESTAGRPLLRVVIDADQGWFVEWSGPSEAAKTVGQTNEPLSQQTKSSSGACYHGFVLGSGFAPFSRSIRSRCTSLEAGAYIHTCEPFWSLLYLQHCLSSTPELGAAVLSALLQLLVIGSIGIEVSSAWNFISICHDISATVGGVGWELVSVIPFITIIVLLHRPEGYR